jgi:hypothetical protein
VTRSLRQKSDFQNNLVLDLSLLEERIYLRGLKSALMKRRKLLNLFKENKGLVDNLIEVRVNDQSDIQPGVF